MAGQGTGGHRAAHVQRLGGAEAGQPGRARGEGCVEVEGVGEVELGVDPHGPLVGDLTEVEVEVPPIGGLAAALLGLVGVVAAQGVLDGTFDLRIRAADATWWARWVSTYPAPSGHSDLVAWAILRAFHTGTRPGSTTAQSFGSR